MKQTITNSDLNDKNSSKSKSNKLDNNIYYNNCIKLLILLFIFSIFFNHTKFQKDYKSSFIKIKSHMKELIEKNFFIIDSNYIFTKIKIQNTLL